MRGQVRCAHPLPGPRRDMQHAPALWPPARHAACTRSRHRGCRRGCECAASTGEGACGRGCGRAASTGEGAGAGQCPLHEARTCSAPIADSGTERRSHSPSARHTIREIRRQPDENNRSTPCGSRAVGRYSPKARASHFSNVRHLQICKALSSTSQIRFCSKSQSFCKFFAVVAVDTSAEKS